MIELKKQLHHKQEMLTNQEHEICDLQDQFEQMKLKTDACEELIEYYKDQLNQ